MAQTYFVFLYEVVYVLYSSSLLTVFNPTFSQLFVRSQNLYSKLHCTCTLLQCTVVVNKFIVQVFDINLSFNIHNLQFVNNTVKIFKDNKKIDFGNRDQLVQHHRVQGRKDEMQTFFGRNYQTMYCKYTCKEAT